MDEPRPGTARGWLMELGKELDARLPALKRREDYYNGKHRLAFATSRFRETFGNLFGAFADNWCPIVVDASAERLQVEGFRFGDAAEDDAEAWRVWQANAMNAQSQLAHTEAIKLGAAYALVTPRRNGPARITVEHPSQMIVAHAPDDRRERLAALKRWSGRDGRCYATVYTPTHVYKFQTAEPVRDVASPMDVEWVPREGVRAVEEHGLGVVPVVPLYNEPTMLGEGRSDLDLVIPIQDAVNKLVMDMIVASEFAAFKQRFATGIEIPTDEDGQPLPQKRFLSAVASVWAVEDPEAKFGEFSATDLSNYVGAIAMLIQHMAAQTRTPIHYLLAELVNISADAIRAAESGLVAKVRRKMVYFGEGWEETMRIALGRDLESGDGETRWRDPETRSHAELADALLKAREIGIPEEMLWERYGLSADEIARARRIRSRDLAQAALAGIYPPTDQGDVGGEDLAEEA